ncbi:MAG TPA: hypothetical protein PLO63_16595 [Syntrophales bacterium]|nr:hypothetical protein [Syntrophales bacterium]
MNSRPQKLMWIIITIMSILLIAYLDWLTGLELNLYVFYFMPVAVGAWFIGLWFTIVLAVFSALLWFRTEFLLGHFYSSAFYAVWDTTIHLISFLAIGLSVSRMRFLYNVEQKRAVELNRALSEVKVLEAFLPICAECKKIRDQQGGWQQLEAYIVQQTGSQFSHTYCPECAKKALADAGLIGKKKS